MERRKYKDLRVREVREAKRRGRKRSLEDEE